MINKQPTSWVKSSRGLHQGDPLSSYLFIIVAQNLTTLLNFVMRIHMIPSFNHALRNNFNHLMYADNLILITQATRKSARNINLCFNIYKRLAGQCANKISLIFIFLPGLTAYLKIVFVKSLALI